MILAPFPDDETSRLRALHSLNILDTPSDVRLDCIVRFTAQTFEVPICLITLIDTNRQCFKSAWGVEGTEVPRSISICAHAICEISTHKPDARISEIYDTKEDVRFFDNPLVVDDPWVRSYLSYVLQSESGKNIGTLCLMGTQPRKFTYSEKYLLTVLGAMVENLINGHPFSTGIEHELN